MAIAVKSYLNFESGSPEIRRFSVPEDVGANFAYLVEKIQRTYPVLLRQEFQLFWRGRFRLTSLVQRYFCLFLQKLLETKGSFKHEFITLLLRTNANLGRIMKVMETNILLLLFVLNIQIKYLILTFDYW